MIGASYNVWDYWRLADVALGAFCLGLAGVTMIVYARANLEAARAAGHTRRRGDRPALRLTRHVTAISAAHSLAILELMSEVIDRIGKDVGFTLLRPLAAGAFLLTIYALWQMLGFQRHRRAELHRGTVDTAPEQRNR